MTALMAFSRQVSVVSILGGCGCLLYAWSLTCYPVAGFRPVPRSGRGIHILRDISPLFVTGVMMLGLGLMAVSVVVMLLI